jgi:hypothetical protein
MGASVPEVHWHDQTHVKSLAIVEGDTDADPRCNACRYRRAADVLSPGMVVVLTPKPRPPHHRGASIELRTVCWFSFGIAATSATVMNWSGGSAMGEKLSNKRATRPRPARAPHQYRHAGSDGLLACPTR